MSFLTRIITLVVVVAVAVFFVYILFSQRDVPEVDLGNTVVAPPPTTDDSDTETVLSVAGLSERASIGDSVVVFGVVRDVEEGACENCFVLLSGGTTTLVFTENVDASHITDGMHVIVIGRYTKDGVAADGVTHHDILTRTVPVGVEEELRIELEANETTGFEWSATFDESFLTLRGHDYVPHDGEQLGRGGTDTFVFETLQEGTTDIHFVYVRSWEQDVLPIDQRLFTIEIGVEGEKE